MCCLVHRGTTGELLLIQDSNGEVWQSRDLQLFHNTLYLLSPRLCFFIVIKRDLFVYRDDSLKRGGLAQWLASRTTDQGVPGSSPGRVAVRCDLEQVTFIPCLVLVKLRKL